MSFHVQAYMCVLSYNYKESTHLDVCLVKRAQRITVLKVYECHPLNQLPFRPTVLTNCDTIRCNSTKNKNKSNIYGPISIIWDPKNKNKQQNKNKTNKTNKTKNKTRYLEKTRPLSADSFTGYISTYVDYNHAKIINFQSWWRFSSLDLVISL